MCRKPFLFAAIPVLAVVTLSSHAAISYDFRQVSRSDFENPTDGEVAGTAVIDGGRSRVDLLRGSTQTPGTYIISNNDTQVVFVVDPLHKRFTEINAAKIASAFASNRIEISNLKSNLAKLNDHPNVAGLPTDHFRVIVTYDITVMFANLPLKQSVVTTIDKWVTAAFGELGNPGVPRAGMRTGNVSIDQLIEAEMTKVKGFPLRQVTSIQTTAHNVQHSNRSELKLRPTRTQTSELVISRISATISEPTMFEIPKSYEKVDADAPGEGPVVQMLTMTP